MQRLLTKNLLVLIFAHKKWVSTLNNISFNKLIVIKSLHILLKNHFPFLNTTDHMQNILQFLHINKKKKKSQFSNKKNYLILLFHIQSNIIINQSLYFLLLNLVLFKLNSSQLLSNILTLQRLNIIEEEILKILDFFVFQVWNIL